MYDALHVFAREAGDGHRTSGYSFAKLWRTKFMLLLRRNSLRQGRRQGRRYSWTSQQIVAFIRQKLSCLDKDWIIELSELKPNVNLNIKLNISKSHVNRYLENVFYRFLAVNSKYKCRRVGILQLSKVMAGNSCCSWLGSVLIVEVVIWPLNLSRFISLCAQNIAC
jgi:hypothetical protein